MFDAIKKLVTWLWTHVWSAVLTALFGAIVITRLVNWIEGPDSYKVYFVGDFADPIVGIVWHGFKQADLPDLHINDVPVKLESVRAEEGEAELDFQDPCREERHLNGGRPRDQYSNQRSIAQLPACGLFHGNTHKSAGSCNPTD